MDAEGANATKLSDDTGNDNYPQLFKPLRTIPEDNNVKKLPIGISTFKDIIEEGYLYVDKTLFVKKLADKGRYYFLSR